MSLPLVVSASKVSTISMPNICENYTQAEYVEEPYFIVSTDNVKTSKIYKHKKQKTVKKGKNKRRSNHFRNSCSDCEATLGFCSVVKGKNKRKGAERNSLDTSTTKNNNLNSPHNSVVFCTVKKLISSYSPKKSPPKPKSTQVNVASSPRRPQTCISKPLHLRAIQESYTKGQSCPPIRQSQSPLRRNVRLRKVYYSEAQSRMLAGIPCPPPATPLNDVVIAVEIVPCMADIKSQQLIKARLKNIEIQREKANEKIRNRCVKDEKEREKQQRECIRQQRRAEIYALNKAMTDLERNKFLQFMKDKSKGATVIPLNV